MENKILAHIEKITAINPIENADNLLLANVLGWQCVISKKDDFKVNDLIIYVEVGSILPDKPEFEFFRKYNFRIKTQKMRGIISQGLILPLNLIPQEYTIEEGKDVTDILGITKYYTKEELLEQQEEAKQFEFENKLRKFLMKYKWYRRLFPTKKQKKGFPNWVTKTNEINIKNIPEVLEQFKDKYVYVTEKIDGQNFNFTGGFVPRFNNWIGIKLFNLINKL